MRKTIIRKDKGIFGILKVWQRFRPAFTMAEILISLTIIGVIAAITLPALQANINESAWKAQRKALYSRMSQAISMMPSLNGYGLVQNEDGTINYSDTNQKAALAFISEGLSKVFKMNNICDVSNLAKCGVPDKLSPMFRNKFDFPLNLTSLNPMFTSTYTVAGSDYINPQNDIDTNVAAFETSNGESVAVFYNPLCLADMHETEAHYTQPLMCADFVYDLNGRKGPNKMGKDVGFITALYSTDSDVVAPMPLQKAVSNTTVELSAAPATCRAHDKDSRLPNIDELTAIFYNKKFIDEKMSGGFLSGSLLGKKAWYLNFNFGRRFPVNFSSGNIYCIKR